ncbi:MAG: ParB/RepB/Spo0J family partition protein, partial [Oscillospiraceae bacterium]
PVIVRELSDEQTMEIALIENLQRQDLNAIEEALGYRTLIDEYKMTQEQVATRVGKSRPVVANALRLLGLPNSILTNVRKGILTSSHARALLSIEDSHIMQETADKIIKDGLSVREIEQLGKKLKSEKSVSPTSNMQLSDVNKKIWDNAETFYKEMELALSQELARKVKITVGNSKGSIEIEFYNESELGELASRLVKRKLNY